MTHDSLCRLGDNRKVYTDPKNCQFCGLIAEVEERARQHERNLHIEFLEVCLERKGNLDQALLLYGLLLAQIPQISWDEAFRRANSASSLRGDS